MAYPGPQPNPITTPPLGHADEIWDQYQLQPTPIIAAPVSHIKGQNETWHQYQLQSAPIVAAPAGHVEGYFEQNEAWNQYQLQPAPVGNTEGYSGQNELWDQYQLQTAPVGSVEGYLEQNELWGQYQLQPTPIGHVGGYFEQNEFWDQYQLQPTPMATVPLGHVEEYPSPTEVLSGPLPILAAPEPPKNGGGSQVRGSDAEQNEVSDERQLQASPPPPAAAVPLSPRTTRRKTKRPVPEDYSCGITCTGEFLGKHQCVRNDGKLAIECKYHKYYFGRPCGKTFKTRGMFNRHFSSHHLDYSLSLLNMVDCTFKGCQRVGPRGFSRHDNMLQHLRRIHKMDIPKVHVWPRMKKSKPARGAEPDAARSSGGSK